MTLSVTDRILSVTVTARMLSVYDYFLRFGFTENGAAAIVGNGCGESGANLDSTFERVNADHGSGGFLEWRDSSGSPRKTRLAGFCDARGPGLRDDIDTQCDYAMWELQRYFPVLDQQLRNPGRAIPNLTANFCWAFENPAPATAGLDNRIAHAEAVAARAAELKQVPRPAPTPAPVPAPQVPVPTLPVPTGPPSIPASWAARLAVELNQLTALQTAYREEMPTPFDDAIASLQKLGTAPPPPLQLPQPAAVPAVVTPPRSQKMFGISINWKTTLSGLVAAASGIAAQYPQFAPYAQIISAVATGFLGLSAKDANVTGGTVSNVTGVAGMPVSLVDREAHR